MPGGYPIDADIEKAAKHCTHYEKEGGMHEKELRSEDLGNGWKLRIWKMGRSITAIAARTDARHIMPEKAKAWQGHKWRLIKL